jgi:hypothetical protein
MDIEVDDSSMTPANAVDGLNYLELTSVKNRWEVAVGENLHNNLGRLYGDNVGKTEAGYQ